MSDHGRDDLASALRQPAKRRSQIVAPAIVHNMPLATGVRNSA